MFLQLCTTSGLCLPSTAVSSVSLASYNEAWSWAGCIPVMGCWKINPLWQINRKKLWILPRSTLETPFELRNVSSLVLVITRKTWHGHHYVGRLPESFLINPVPAYPKAEPCIQLSAHFLLWSKQFIMFILSFVGKKKIRGRSVKTELRNDEHYLGDQYFCLGWKKWSVLNNNLENELVQGN